MVRLRELSRLRRYISHLREECDAARKSEEDARSVVESEVERVINGRRDLLRELRDKEERMRVLEDELGQRVSIEREEDHCINDGFNQVGNVNNNNYYNHNLSSEQHDGAMIKKCRMLELRLAAVGEETQSLRKKIGEADNRSILAEAKLRDIENGHFEDKSKNNDDRSYDEGEPDTNSSLSTKIVSVAPPSVLSELHRTRAKLAEEECKVRQLNRKVESLDRKSREIPRYAEETRAGRRKIDTLTEEVNGLRCERARWEMSGVIWDKFKRDLICHPEVNLMIDNCDEDAELVGHDSMCARKEEGGKVDDYEVCDNKINIDSNVKDNQGAVISNKSTLVVKQASVEIPPQVESVIRAIKSLRSESLNRINEANEIKLQLKSEKSEHNNLQSTLEELNSTLHVLKKEKNAIDEKGKRTEGELAVMKRRGMIWKREVESLRELLETYRKTEESISGNTRINKSDKNVEVNDDIKEDEKRRYGKDPKVDGLETSLTAAKSHGKLLEESNTFLLEEKDKSVKKLEALQSEHDKVVEKFYKLRDALKVAKSKAEQAECRADSAERSAGKGTFSPEETKVLHLTTNPLSNAVKLKYEAELYALRETLSKVSTAESEKVADGENDHQILLKSSSTPSSSSASSPASLNAEKLNRRLKESFQKQIGIFREGVHLLTGYKIDMITEDKDPERPKFRVRSVYAEREEDHLMVSWPKLNKGEEATSLDLLDTELAQVLSREPSCFGYMEKYGSLPAFMASVTLTLFEKQTFVE